MQSKIIYKKIKQKIQSKQAIKKTKNKNKIIIGIMRMRRLWNMRLLRINKILEKISL